MNRRYRWYVIKCVTLTHAFSLWPARTSALEVGKSKEPWDEIGLTVAYGDVDSVDADAWLFDVHPSIVAVVRFQERWNRVGRQDRDLWWHVCCMYKGSVRNNREVAEKRWG